MCSHVAFVVIATLLYATSPLMAGTSNTVGCFCNVDILYKACSKYSC